MASLWERMVLEESKQKANKRGVRVSQIEEEELLTQTIAASLANSEVSGEQKAAQKRDEVVTKIKEDELDDDEVDSDIHSVGAIGDMSTIEIMNSTSNIKLVDEDSGPWGQLPFELVDKVLCFVGDPDMLGILRIASRNTFQPSEAVYRFVSEYIYLRQCAKKRLIVGNWGSWKNMLINRPRIRTNGFYTLRTSFTKAPCNDAFWEEKKREFIEV